MERYREIEKSIIKKYRKEIWSRFVRAIKDYEQLISNFPKYQDNSLYNDYSVKKSSGERYSTNKNNTELQSFLKSIDVSLDKCLMSEYD